jgi:glutathione S-transferase
MKEDQLLVWGIGTSRTMRVHWMLHELGLDYETKPIAARSGETSQTQYRRINPKGKIPCLQHGSISLSESHAILHYLSSLADSPGHSEYQQSIRARARYDEWSSFILMELDATSLYVMRRHQDLHEIYGEAANANRAAREYFLKQLDAVLHSIPPEEGFLWGSQFSEIDILMVTCLDWASHYRISLPDRASRYRERIISRPGYQRAVAANYRSPD